MCYNARAVRKLFRQHYFIDKYATHSLIIKKKEKWHLMIQNNSLKMVLRLLRIGREITPLCTAEPEPVGCTLLGSLIQKLKYLYNKNDNIK